MIWRRGSRLLARMCCACKELRARRIQARTGLHYVDPYRSLNQRADLFGDVSALLPGYQTQFTAAARGELSDKTGRAVASERGIAAWVTPELAITAARHFFIHGQFRPDGWGPEPVPHAMQILRICDLNSGGDVICAHLHGVRDPNGKGDTPARAAQTEAIIAGLRNMTCPGPVR